MRAYWPLDEASLGNYSELIGAQDGLCSGSCPTPYPGGRLGYAQDFNGIDSGIRVIPSGSQFDWTGAQSFSIALWMRAVELLPLSEQALLAREGWSLTLGSDGRLRFRLADQVLAGSTFLSDGRWHHVVAEYSASGKMRLYVDSVLDEELDVALSGAFGSAGASIDIGFSGQLVGSHFDGAMEQVALYERLLTAQERAQLTRDGLVDFRSGYCEERPTLRIMPLGDSNTVGTPDSGGYRQQLYSDLVSLGYLVDFVGSQASGSSVNPPFDRDHEGHWGWRDDEIADNIFDWLTNEPADIVLLHIGTNALDSDPSDVAQILDEIDRYSSHVTVVLARIINRASYSALTSEFNENITQMANERLALGDKIVIVDMEPALTYPADMADEYHPNAVGFGKMAQVWLEGLQRFYSSDGSFPPWITSTPTTGVALGSLYSYDVLAQGKPSASYAFGQNSAHPVGMSIDATSGLITWVADSLGTWDIELVASNSLGSNTQSFSLTVTDDLIIDNGDAGSKSSGSWLLSAGPDPYGIESLYSWGAGSSYSFTGLSAAPLQVSLYWTYTSSRCTSVPVNIYDGQQLIHSATVNQQNDASDWVLLGSFNFSSAARIELLSSDNCSTSADAARFQVVQPANLLYVEIEGPTSIVENSSQSYGCRAYYDDGSDRLVTADSWSENSPFTSIDSNGILQSTEVSGEQLVQLDVSYSEDGTAANASLAVTVSDFTATTIDNGELGSSFEGDWLISGASDPFGPDSLYSSTAGSSYTFETSASDWVELALRWTNWTSRCTSVPVDIYDGPLLLDSLTINQQQDAADWNVLGNYPFTSTARIVISSPGGCSTSVDAARFAPGAPVALESVSIEGPLELSEESEANYSLRATYSDGSSRLVDANLWTQDSSYASIDSNGTLSTLAVEQTESSEISASYSENGQELVAHLDVSILNFAGSIVDNGDPGSFAVGSWDISGGANPYGSDSLWSSSAGSRYLLRSGSSGTLSLELWWTTFSSRCANTIVEILDGGTLIDTVFVDQRSNGGQWMPLGVYAFTQEAQIAIKAQSSCTSSADAARFLPSTAPPSGGGGGSQEPGELIIDNGDPGSFADGDWPVSGGPNPYGPDSVYSNTAGDSYHFEAGIEGSAEISLRWTYFSSRCTAVPVEVFDGGTLLFATTVDQQAGAATWNSLGSFDFSGSARVVIYSEGGCSSSADAVRFD